MHTQTHTPTHVHIDTQTLSQASTQNIFHAYEYTRILAVEINLNLYTRQPSSFAV